MSSLRLIAGKTARERIEENGLSPELIRLVVGASGGPKWLVLFGLDKLIFGEWLTSASQKIDLVGSSIGAWRMASASHPDPAKTIQTFIDQYFEFRAEHTVNTEILDRTSRLFLNNIYGSGGIEAILSNKKRGLNIVTARTRGLEQPYSRLRETGRIVSAAAMNTVSRDRLASVYDRVIFHTGEKVCCSHAWPGFQRTDIALLETNFEDALMASGSIPLVTEPVENIAGAPPGVYRDGGILDYHFDVPWQYDDGIVLYPHFYGHIVPGWFDKKKKNRRLRGQPWDQILLLAPSDDFVRRLPTGKIPDRKNFRGMNDTDRIKYWTAVIKESERLAEEYSECINNPGLLMDRIEEAPQ